VADVIGVIERATLAGEDTWEAAVSAGIQAQENMDTGRWTIGDLALLVVTKYGDNSVQDFAKSIKVEASRVKEYRTVARFWEKSARADIRESFANISYSHMREAMRLKDVDAAMKFIEECSLNDYTVEMARIKLNERLGKPMPPRKVAELICNVQQVQDDTLTLSIRVATGDLLEEGRDYNFVIYECANEENENE